MELRPTPEQVLDLKLPTNDSGATTVRGYLTELLVALWSDEANFSGKRPFGESGWQYDIYGALIEAGWVKGTITNDGEFDVIDDVDDATADVLILEAIRTLGRTEPS